MNNWVESTQRRAGHPEPDRRVSARNHHVQTYGRHRGSQLWVPAPNLVWMPAGTELLSERASGASHHPAPDTVPSAMVGLRLYFKSKS